MLALRHITLNIRLIRYFHLIANCSDKKTERNVETIGQKQKHLQKKSVLGIPVNSAWVWGDLRCPMSIQANGFSIFRGQDHC